MILKVPLIIVCIFCYGLVIGQDRRPTGLILEDEYFNSVEKDTFPDGVKEKIKEFVDLKKYCPMAGDQKGTETCVAWATGYGGLTICRAIRDSIIDRDAITEMANSVAFIFNNIKEDAASCQEGAKFSAAFDLLQTKGDCLAISFDDTISSCQQLPAEYHEEEAKAFKLKNYGLVLDREDHPKIKIEILRKVLSSNQPLIIGMDITESFYEVTQTESLWQPTKEEKIEWAHAMVVVGYDHSKKEIEILNSYGNCWGDDGFFKIKYDDFNRLVRYGFQMVIDDQSIVRKQNPIFSYLNTLWERYVASRNEPAYRLRGECYLESNELQKNAIYIENQGYYETVPWKVNDELKLKIKNINPKAFIYVFGYDAKGRIKFYEKQSPDDLANEEDFSRNLTVPQNGILQLNEKGVEYVCVLFSEKKINNFENQIKQLPIADNDFIKSVKAFYKINLQSVVYSHDTMQFEIPKNTSRNLIPIFLKLNVE